MPLSTAQPVAVRQANTWQIVGFVASLPLRAGDPPTMQISYVAGFADGQGVTWYEPQTVGVEPAALLQLMAEPVPPNTSLYAALKAAMYGYLQQAGYIPQEASEA